MTFGLLPWEAVAPGVLPWEGSFIYSRIVSILRVPPAGGSSAVPPSAGIGATGYAGLPGGRQGQINPRNYPAVLTGLPAAVETHRIGSAPEERLPADARGKSTWRIFIPFSAAAPGTILDRDAVLDDLGRMFHVIAAYTNSLGHDLYSEVLET